MTDSPLPSDLAPRIVLCPNGCVHLHIGKVALLMNRQSLRALAEAAAECLDELARDPAWLGTSKPFN